MAAAINLKTVKSRYRRKRLTDFYEIDMVPRIGTPYATEHLE